jgi:hypothetical protein
MNAEELRIYHKVYQQRHAEKANQHAKDWQRRNPERVDEARAMRKHRRLEEIGLGATE